jgi:hypothetical protein
MGAGVRSWAGCAEPGSALGAGVSLRGTVLGAGVSLRGAAVAAGDGGMLTAVQPSVLPTPVTNASLLTVSDAAVRILLTAVAAEPPTRAMAGALAGLVAAR